MHYKTIDEVKVQTVLDKLNYIARKGSKDGLVFYSEAGNWVNIDMDTQAERNRLADILGTISDREYKAGRPCLSVIVVQKEDHMPSSGFIDWMTELGIYSGSRDFKTKNKFIFDEMKKVWAYWEKH